MSAELGLVPARARSGPASSWSRIYGLGSVYAKTLRDSRLAILILAGLLSGLILAAGADYGKTYATPNREPTSPTSSITCRPRWPASTATRRPPTSLPWAA